MISKNNTKNRPLGCMVGVVGVWLIVIYLVLLFFTKDIPQWPIYIAIGMILIGGIKMAMMDKKEDNENLIEQNIDPNNLVYSGKYISGHKDIDNSTENTFLSIAKDEIKILSKNPKYPDTKVLATINIPTIKSIVIEDETTIQSRVGVKRLLLLGLFAFAFKKKEKHHLAYVVIEWFDGRFYHDTVFEFEGKRAISDANTLKNKLTSLL